MILILYICEILCFCDLYTFSDMWWCYTVQGLIYLTVWQVKSGWDQRDFTLIRLPLSHKKHMFLFFHLCVLTVCTFGINPRLWTRETASPHLQFTFVFFTKQCVTKLCQSIHDSVHHMARLLKLRGLNCVWKNTLYVKAQYLK